MTPIAPELLSPSLAPFGRSITLPAEAYTDESVFWWEQHFFDESWVCLGHEYAVYQLITMVANGYLEGGVARPVSREPEAAR